MTKILQFRIYVYTILFTYGYVQYVSDQNGYHTHKRTNCNIMYQHSDVTRLRCTLFNKKLILEKWHRYRYCREHFGLSVRLGRKGGHELQYKQCKIMHVGLHNPGYE